MRASAAAEKAGVPSASLVCEDFIGQGATTADGLGMPNLPIAKIPGHVELQTKEQLEKNIAQVTLDAVIQSLTVQPEAAKPPIEPGAEDIIFTGTFEEVNQFFYENEWSDGYLLYLQPLRGFGSL